MTKNDRDHMFSCNREKIEHAYALAVANGVERPVVLVFDLSGKETRHFAEQVVDEERINEVTETAERRGVGACAIRSCASDDAVALLSSLSLHVESVVLGGLADGTFAVAVISDDGITWKRVKAPDDFGRS